MGPGDAKADADSVLTQGEWVRVWAETRLDASVGEVKDAES